MSVKLLAFGRLAEIISQPVELQDVSDTDTLMELLYSQYPSLRGQELAIAVNQSVIHGNTILSQDVTVALLPPYSGG